MVGRAIGVCLSFGLMLLGAAADASGADALAALEQRIRSGEIPNVHSVIVMQKDKTLAEWYFEGKDEKRGAPLGVVKFGPETIHDLRSVTKSIVGLLLGIAEGQGAIKLDAPALDYFPQYKELQTPERRKITVRHLVTMTSGLHWDEESYPYTDRRNSETAMDLASDRLRFVLEQRLDSAPGEKFRYSGGDVALVGEILARATKQPMDEYAKAVLFAPLGITKLEWLKDDRGVPFAASGLRMLPRDMMKVGVLMLHNGKHGGRQIVPEAWTMASVTPHALVEKDDECGFHYGYFWWLVPKCDAGKGPGWFAALGNGGQRIFVAPERELVVVVTAGLYNSPQQQAIRQITRGVIAATN